MTLAPWYCYPEPWPPDMEQFFLSAVTMNTEHVPRYTGTRVVWTLCEARRVAPPVQTTASCFPYSLIGFYDYPI